MTITTKLVLRALANGCSYGRQISRATELASGTVHPILGRLEAYGWVTSRWDDADPATRAGRPPRRFYTLTAEGRANVPPPPKLTPADVPSSP